MEGLNSFNIILLLNPLILIFYSISQIQNLFIMISINYPLFFKIHSNNFKSNLN